MIQDAFLSPNLPAGLEVLADLALAVTAMRLPAEHIAGRVPSGSSCRQSRRADTSEEAAPSRHRGKPGQV